MLVTNDPAEDRRVDDEGATARTAGAVVELDDVVHQVIYLQLRPRFQVVAKCLGELEATLTAHPEVKVDIAGVGRNDHQLLLTLGVDAGPRREVPRFGPSAVAAFELTEAVFSLLSDYMPRYTGAPTRDEAELASSLPDVLGFVGQASPDRLDATAG